MKRKVTVVGGAGNVGATVARAIAEKELADVVIIDVADQKAAGVALDMYQACPILGSDTRLIGGNDWSAAAGPITKRPSPKFGSGKTSRKRKSPTPRFSAITRSTGQNSTTSRLLAGSS